MVSKATIVILFLPYPDRPFAYCGPPTGLSMIDPMYEVSAQYLPEKLVTTDIGEDEWTKDCLLFLQAIYS